MPRRYHRKKLGSRQPLPVSLSQLAGRQLLLLAVALLCLRRISPEARHATPDHLKENIRTFLAWFLPLTVLVHTAGAVLHEGPPFGLTIRRRTTALAICAPIGMFIFFWAATLFGASVVEHGWNTLHWAALMASIVVAPMAAVAGLEGRRWQYVFAHWSPSGTDELSAAVPAFAAILATWLGAFPTPLDWGTQWQVWPVSSTVMAVAAYLLGVVAVIPIAVYMQQSSRQSVELSPAAT